MEIDGLEDVGVNRRIILKRVLKVEWEGVYCTRLAQNREKRRTHVNVVMNIPIAKNEGNFLTSWGRASFSRTTLLGRLSYKYHKKDIQSCAASVWPKHVAGIMFSINKCCVWRIFRGLCAHITHRYERQQARHTRSAHVTLGREWRCSVQGVQLAVHVRKRCDVLCFYTATSIPHELTIYLYVGLLYLRQ